jgi:segregation and condensation protein A
MHPDKLTSDVMETSREGLPGNLPSDGIEMLVHLARTGRIDPWNIDIVEVTDQYLQLLGELKSHDLKLTGKALLYAAILLRMKSDSLAGVNYLALSSDDETGWDDMASDNDFLDLGLTPEPTPLQKLGRVFDQLDRMIQRRTSVKQPRIRKVTLTDLIAQLRQYEAMEAQRRLKESVDTVERRRIRSYTHLSSEDIIDLAHDEFIEDTIGRMQHILERFFQQNEAMSLTQLETEGKIDRVSAFIAVLFLASRSEVELEQEGFYTELYIVPPEAAILSDPLTATGHEVSLPLAG